MGLTIHYTIRFKGGKSLLQKHLKQIRQKCLDMPFEEVGNVTVREITESAWRVFNDLQRWCIFPNNSEENLSKRDKILKDRFGLETWDFIEAQSYYFRNGEIIERMDKPATRVGLSLWPDEGCESSDLNFLKRGNKYICSSFCKTQYAEHFVRSHLLVIALLDMVKEIGGFNVEVHEGFYIDYDSFRGFVNLENVEIWNEYDEKISKDIFITMIQKKTKDKAHSDDYPDNCKSDGDIELNYGEFS